MHTDKLILVLGATGQQGGAVLNHLVKAGWRVRALTRDKNSKKAKSLVQKNIEIVEADIENLPALNLAMQGVYGVFSVQPFEPIDIEKEVQMGINVADAAKKAGVEHFIYTSFEGAEEQAKFRDLAKWEIEKHIQSIGLPATIFRLPMFMENFLTFTHYGLQNGVYADATQPNIPVNLIAIEDIGVFVSLAFDHPNEYVGKTISLASDAVTPPNIAAAISRVSGTTITYKQIPMEALRKQDEEIAKVYDWINQGKSRVDLAYLRKLHPNLTTFDKWLDKKGKIKFESFFRENKGD
ncbi:NmrA/HSCARG family protein [Shimazuella sp. AN120528]|nr:NmrA/HSCARG family protein [Shimazuella soli]